MFRLALLTLLAACAPGAGTPSDTTGADDTGDTAAVTAPVTSSGPAAHALEESCVAGEMVDAELGGQPLLYQVEVKYADGTYEPLQSTIHMRPSIAMIDGSLTDYESPVYRKGGTLTFPCGYAWEAEEGPRLDGEQVGKAVGYRVTWLTQQ